MSDNEDQDIDATELAETVAAPVTNLTANAATFADVMLLLRVAANPGPVIKRAEKLKAMEDVADKKVADAEAKAATIEARLADREAAVAQAEAKIDEGWATLTKMTAEFVDEKLSLKQQIELLEDEDRHVRNRMLKLCNAQWDPRLQSLPSWNEIFRMLGMPATDPHYGTDEGPELPPSPAFDDWTPPAGSTLTRGDSVVRRRRNREAAGIL